MELIVQKSKEIIEHLTPHAISFYVRIFLFPRPVYPSKLTRPIDIRPTIRRRIPRPRYARVFRLEVSSKR